MSIRLTTYWLPELGTNYGFIIDPPSREAEEGDADGDPLARA